MRLALVFGSTVAEGFIAVQAERGESIQDVGRRVLRLSESLGLGDAVVPHCQSIIDAAGEKEWRRVREELDRTQQTVRTTMEKLRDDDLANLVSLGGWLRGTEAVTAIVSGTYSPDKAELLNQPDIVRHFRDEIAAMNQLVRSEPEVVAIAEGLSVILGEIEKAEGAAPSADAVLRIGETCRTLLEGFYFEKPKPAPTGSNSQP